MDPISAFTAFFLIVLGGNTYEAIDKLDKRIEKLEKQKIVKEVK